MENNASFGSWIRRRRKALDLTQEELAERVGCALDTIRKIEARARRPSRQVAERLADQLDVSPEVRTAFLQAARAELAADRLTLPPAPTPPAPTLSRPQHNVPPSILPSGTVTFLCTDIVGSTQLWERQHDAMRLALARHDTILRQTIAAHGGVVFKSGGDGIYAAFTRAPDALAAAVTAQQALLAEPWEATSSLHVRMVLHTGAAEERDGDYFGPPLNRVARLLAVGHGSQILLSRATQELVCDTLPPDVTLWDLGSHRLKDLARPEQIVQVVAPNLPTDFPPLHTLDMRPHNLPAQLTPLIGRRQEVAAVCDRLRRDEVRLLTLTGTGGTGKTRLALQVGAELLDDFSDGVWLVDLAPISDPVLLASSIAHILGVKEASDQPLVERLKAYLKSKQLLLVLDNFEQIVTAAPVVEELLAAAPQAKVLITSRMVLHLYGEHVFVVPPLAIPDPAHLPLMDSLSQYDAVRLFIDRARAVKADFTVTNTNAPAVAEICVRLDGLPLAIELAAARSKLFAPDALLNRLTNRLQMLTGGSRTRPARQQTLRNTIAWSYDLLDANEQRLFARLGVFVGGRTQEAIEAVCDADSDLGMEVLDGLALLVDKSLLQQDERIEGEPRFTMLETIHEYARERLVANGESELLQRRHAAYFLAWIEAAEPQLHGPDQPARLDRLEREHANFRAALNRSLNWNDAETALRLASALGEFWEMRGYLNEGHQWLEAALAMAGSSSEWSILRAKAINALGRLAYVLGNYSLACALFQESMAIQQEVGDTRGMAYSHLNLGEIMFRQGDWMEASLQFEQSLTLFREVSDKRGIAWSLQWGTLARRETYFDYAVARPVLEESLAIFRELGDRRGISYVLNIMGEAVRFHGDIMQARDFHEECLAIRRELDDKWYIITSLGNLAQVMQMQGDYARAFALSEEGLILSRDIGAKHGIAYHLWLLAGVIGLTGEPERAARLFGMEKELRDALGVHTMEEVDRAVYDRNVAAVRAQLDEATFVAAWAEGQAMSLEQAIAEALALTIGQQL